MDAASGAWNWSWGRECGGKTVPNAVPRPFPNHPTVVCPEPTLATAACCNVSGERRPSFLPTGRGAEECECHYNQMTPFEKLKAWGSWVVLLPCIRGQVSALSAWRGPGAEALGQGRHRMGEIGLCGKVPHTGAAGGGGREETCAGEQMPGAAPDGSGPEQKEKSQREGGQRNRGLAPLRLPKWRDKIRFLPGTWPEACSETSMQPQTTLKKACNPKPKWPTVWVPELENCWDSNSGAAAFSAVVL